MGIPIYVFCDVSTDGLIAGSHENKACVMRLLLSGELEYQYLSFSDQLLTTTSQQSVAYCSSSKGSVIGGQVKNQDDNIGYGCVWLSSNQGYQLAAISQTLTQTPWCLVGRKNKGYR